MARGKRAGRSPKRIFPRTAHAKRTLRGGLKDIGLRVALCVIARKAARPVEDGERLVWVVMHPDFGSDVVATVPIGGNL